MLTFTSCRAATTCSLFFVHFDVISRYAAKDRMIIFILYAHVSHSIVSVSYLSFCSFLVVSSSQRLYISCSPNIIKANKQTKKSP